MFTRRIILLSAVVVLALGHGSAAFAQPGGAPPQPESVRRATLITVHGKITAVDKAKRLVTLEGPRGRKVVLKVENPYNLQAAKVGEPVVVRYYEVATIRKKKPGEMVPRASVKEGIATAEPGQIPGAMGAREMQIVVSVVKIDGKNGTVTVKGPDGAVETVKARDPENLKRLKVGDELVVSLSQAVAVSLDKEAMME